MNVAAFLPTVLQVGMVREQFQNPFFPATRKQWGQLAGLNAFSHLYFHPTASFSAGVDAMISLAQRLHLDHPILEGYSSKY